MTSPPQSPLTIISSMATRRVLADLVARFQQQSPWPIEVESVGGVKAAERVRAGEPFDIVALANDVIDTLSAEGHVLPGSRVDIVNSEIVVGVRSGTPRPDIGSVEAVKAAVLAARSIGYSTGPSGNFLASLFKQWGIADAVQERVTVAPAGVPVASLVAKGEIELGFQQLSEFLGVEGVDVLGTLPPGIHYITTFSGGIATTSTQPEAARTLLQFFGSAGVADIKRANGMSPAS